MMWSAPSFLRVSALASEEVVEMTRAPAALANCTANMLTPPVPCVRTVSPGFKLLPSMPYSAFHAVNAAHGSVLPCWKFKVEGIWTKPASSKEPY